MCCVETPTTTVIHGQCTHGWVLLLLLLLLLAHVPVTIACLTQRPARITQRPARIHPGTTAEGRRDRGSGQTLAARELEIDIAKRCVKRKNQGSFQNHTSFTSRGALIRLVSRFHACRLRESPAVVAPPLPLGLGTGQPGC